MENQKLVSKMTLDEKIDYYFNYFSKQGKTYQGDTIREGINYLSYKTVPQDLPKEESDTEPTLYAFRHGQTTDNADFVFSGWRDPDVTKKGEEQALSLAEKIKDKKIDLLYSSDLKRAIRTMEFAISKNESAKALEIHQDPRIKERSYGIYQGKNKLEIYLKDPKELEGFRRSFEVGPEGGESIETVCVRVAGFLDELTRMMKKKNINVAISCHGNSIRGIRRYFENLNDYDTAHVETPLGQDYLAYVIR